jgi:protein-tyrosine phosphatase
MQKAIPTDEHVDCSKITDHIFLGPAYVASGYPTHLKELGVTHIANITVRWVKIVLTLQANERCAFPKEFEYLQISINDFPGVKIDDHFDQVHSFMDGAIFNGGKVYVHCQAGVSRSSTMVISYIMTRKRMSLRDSFSLVKKHRPVILPNPGFFAALMRLDEATHGHVSMSVEDYNVFQMSFLKSRGFAVPTAPAQPERAQVVEGGVERRRPSCAESMT